VTIREFFVENFAVDLEYHPRRGFVYLGIGIATACVWIFSPAKYKFNALPLVFALGSLTLVAKGIFLFRRWSEGLGLYDQELVELSDPSRRKSFPSIPTQAAQIVQDFGTGAFLLWPLLNMGKDIDQSWDNPPRLSVFLAGAALFIAGWIVRRATSAPSA
jgi:hypothetical protein